ncbi:MAG: DUF2911 domain-containing protein [Polyangiaceae bacterium]
MATDPADPTPAALRALPALPRPSPNAEVKQDVGVSEVALSYSSPGKKGRTVWGDLVPYEKVWRAGANAPTKLTVTHDFSFGGKPVPAGSYALFIIPSEQRWTLILNRDPKGAGAFEHDPAQDVARAEVTPSSAPDRERLVYLFENSTDDETELVLDWAGRRGSVPITIDTKAIVEKGMTATLQEAWRPFFNAGRYAFDQGDPSRAIELLDQSIAIRPTWWNHWWAAQAQAKAQNVAKAREHADQALLLGKDDQTFQRFFADAVKKALASWPKS